MDFGQVGNNAVTACPYCDKLFAVKAGQLQDDMTLLTAMYETHLAASPTCQQEKDAQPSLEEQFKRLRPIFQDAEIERQERLAAHPDNGRLGWWRVEGIRHEATTRASSAKEAVEKCEKAGEVGLWESADARFLGGELPDVF